MGADVAAAAANAARTAESSLNIATSAAAASATFQGQVTAAVNALSYQATGSTAAAQAASDAVASIAGVATSVQGVVGQMAGAQGVLQGIAQGVADSGTSAAAAAQSAADSSRAVVDAIAGLKMPSNVGVENKIETSNSFLDKITGGISDFYDTVKSAVSSQSQTAAVGRGSDRAQQGLADGQGRADGVSREFFGAGNGGWSTGPGAVSEVNSGASSNFQITIPLAPRGFGNVIDFDPVKTVRSRWGDVAFACKFLLTLLIVLSAYLACVKGVIPLVSQLPSSESVSDTLRTVVSPFGVGVQWSALRPLFSLARLAVLATVPVALIGAFELYLSYLAQTGGGSLSSNSGVPGAALFQSIFSAFSTFAHLAGVGFDLVNLFVPVMTVVFCGLYIGGGYMAALGVYLFAKFKTSALQSV